MDKLERIDVDQLLQKKLPGHYRKIPKWVIRFLEWLICQKDMNRILPAVRDMTGVDFAKGMIRELSVTFDVHGLDDIPDGGRYLFVSNHPLGAFDGMCYISILGSKYRKFKFIVNDMLMQLVNLRPVFLPVSTTGRQQRADMEAVSRAFMSDDVQLATFPAGFCSRWIDGRVQDTEWRKSAVTQAVSAQRDIVPMFFEGRNSATFYAVEFLRRKLGIKFNIGLPLLPRQMVRVSRGKHYRIFIGRPIPYTKFDASRTPRQWAAWLREQCYALPKLIESVKPQ